MRENGLGTSCARCNVASVKAQTNWTDLTTAQTQEDSSSDDSRKNHETSSGELTCQVQKNVEIVLVDHVTVSPTGLPLGPPPAYPRTSHVEENVTRPLASAPWKIPTLLVRSASWLRRWMCCHLSCNVYTRIRIKSTTFFYLGIARKVLHKTRKIEKPIHSTSCIARRPHFLSSWWGKNLPNLKPAESSIKTNDVQRDKKTVCIGTKDSHGKNSKCFHIKLRK